MSLSERQKRAWLRHHEVGCPADGENIACWGPTAADYAWVDTAIRLASLSPENTEAPQ